jgi:hypothetical protein
VAMSENTKNDLEDEELQDGTQKQGLQEVAKKTVPQVTLKQLELKKSIDLELEYACLKILYIILETDEFKNIDFESISYLDDTNDNELVVISDKYDTHKIIRKSEFRTNFSYSPGAFIHYLHVNGAVNERSVKAKKKPAGYSTSEKKQIIVPKVGDFFLDPVTGFWKKATVQDTERFEKERKESLYMKFVQMKSTGEDTTEGE